MKNKPSLVFFGSGPVASKSLRLISDSFEIEAIVTKPATLLDMQHMNKPTRVYAVTNKNELDKLVSIARFKSQFALVIDFGIIVSKEVIESFELGMINSHFSLLPEWCGADPITFTILSGQRRTGVSIMLLTEGMDKGPLLAQAPYAVPEHTTTPILTNSLIELSDITLKTTIPMYLTGRITPRPQKDASLLGDVPPTYSRKLMKQDGLIDWSKSAVQIEREVRAYIEWPKSRTTLANREVIITEAAISTFEGEPGNVILAGKQLHICCGKDSLQIKRLKPAGKTDMSIDAFLAGYRDFL